MGQVTCGDSVRPGDTSFRLSCVLCDRMIEVLMRYNTMSLYLCYIYIYNIYMLMIWMSLDDRVSVTAAHHHLVTSTTPCHYHQSPACQYWLGHPVNIFRYTGCHNHTIITTSKQPCQQREKKMMKMWDSIQPSASGRAGEIQAAKDAQIKCKLVPAPTQIHTRTGLVFRWPGNECVAWSDVRIENVIFMCVAY